MQGGFRMGSGGGVVGIVSHGDICLKSRLQQAGEGGCQRSIQMCFGTKKHNLLGSAVRQRWGKVGIARHLIDANEHPAA